MLERSSKRNLKGGWCDVKKKRVGVISYVTRHGTGSGMWVEVIYASSMLGF